MRVNPIGLEEILVENNECKGNGTASVCMIHLIQAIFVDATILSLLVLIDGDVISLPIQSLDHSTYTHIHTCLFLLSALSTRSTGFIVAIVWIHYLGRPAHLDGTRRRQRRLHGRPPAGPPVGKREEEDDDKATGGIPACCGGGGVGYLPPAAAAAVTNTTIPTRVV